VSAAGCGQRGEDEPMGGVAMERLKGIGGVFLAFAGVIGSLFLFVMYLKGAVWVSEYIFQYVLVAARIVFLVCAFILIPLSFFRFTRIVACIGFLSASYVFGLSAWIAGLLTAYFYWGLSGIIIGLLLGIVGVVPIGFLAALFNSDWYATAILAIGGALTYGARGTALWLATKIDRAEEEKRLGDETVIGSQPLNNQSLVPQPYLEQKSKPTAPLIVEQTSAAVHDGLANLPRIRF
jgi:hypothetical protein